MKLLLTLLSLNALINNVFSQENTMNTVIDNNVDIPEYYWLGMGENYIKYHKLNNNFILRIEDIKIQLIQPNSGLVWEHKFDRILGGTKKLNSIKVSSNEENIFVIHHNFEMQKPGVGNEIFHLYKFDYDGKILKKINFSEINPIEGIKGIELVDGELYIISKTAPLSKGLAYSFDYDYHITALTSDLELKSVHKLPFYVEGTEYNGFRRYKGFLNNEFVFATTYKILDNGKLTATFTKTPDKDYIEIYSIDKDFENPTIEKRKINNTDYQKYFSPWVYRYDTSAFKLISGKFELPPHGSEQLQVSTKSERGNKIPLIIKKGDAQSMDLTEILADNGFGKFKSIPRVYVKEIVSTPLNGGLLIVLSPLVNNTERYFIFLNQNLETVSVYQLRNIKFSPFVPYNNYSYTIAFMAADPGKVNYKKEKKEGFSAALNGSSKVQNTIINYDDFQLLFIDNKKQKTCSMLKFSLD